MATKHKPGNYRASVIDYGVSKTKEGLPQVLVLFRYSDEGVNKDIFWYGSFKDSVVERTVDTLLFLGLKGQVETLAEGVAGRALNVETKAEIVIEDNTYNGTTTQRVAWVNDPERVGAPARLNKAEATPLLASVNAVLARRASMKPMASPDDVGF